MRSAEDEFENRTRADSAAGQKIELCVAADPLKCPGASADTLDAEPDDSLYAPGDDSARGPVSYSAPMIAQASLRHVLLGIAVLALLA